jgi:hypothetical protein
MWRSARSTGGRADPWAMAEWGNWVADGIAGRARKMAEKEEKEWVAVVGIWNAEVDRRDQMGGVAPPVLLFSFPWCLVRAPHALAAWVSFKCSTQHHAVCSDR